MDKDDLKALLYNSSRILFEVQAQQVEFLRNYARVARVWFDNGYTSYIEVLDAKRSLFNAKFPPAQTKGVLFRAPVNLYKAMGGGWVLEADHHNDRFKDLHARF